MNRPVRLSYVAWREKRGLDAADLRKPADRLVRDALRARASGRSHPARKPAWRRRSRRPSTPWATSPYLARRHSGLTIFGLDLPPHSTRWPLDTAARCRSPMSGQRPTPGPRARPLPDRAPPRTPCPPTRPSPGTAGSCPAVR
ncbi:hypothetical protein ABZY34_01585 [Streptomyces virginiae]|uniref:hypothetical protein n=1 Tax=Streptomyces virginiae TaxID=1961 RepID=UPI0033A39687